MASRPTVIFWPLQSLWLWWFRGQPVETTLGLDGSPTEIEAEARTLLDDAS